MKDQTDRIDTGLSSDSREPQITPEAIRAQLDRVMSSPDLKDSKNVKTIFRYLTEASSAIQEE